MATEVAAAEEEEKKKMQILVVPPWPRSFPEPKHIALDAETGDTVASVKAKLEAKVGIPPRRQRLLFAGTELADDGRTLADYGIALADDSATIHLVETKMQVFVRMVKAGPGYSQTFSDLESSDTVESFRAKLQARTGVPPEKQRLTLCKDLKDGHTLGGSGVRGESTLQFNPRLRFRIPARKVELYLRDTDTVRRIKELVEEADGVPVGYQQVFCGGRELEDGLTVAHYGFIQSTNTVSISCQRPAGGYPTSRSTTSSDAAGEPPVAKRIKTGADVQQLSGTAETPERTEKQDDEEGKSCTVPAAAPAVPVCSGEGRANFVRRQVHQGTGQLGEHPGMPGIAYYRGLPEYIPSIGKWRLTVFVLEREHDE